MTTLSFLSKRASALHKRGAALRIGLTALFPVGFGLVILVVLGSVLTFATYNSRETLKENSGQEFDFKTQALAAQVDAAFAGVAALSRSIGEAGALADGVLAATPSVLDVSIFAADGSVQSLDRAGRRTTDLETTPTGGGSANAWSQLRASNAPGVVWTEPFFSAAHNRAVFRRVERAPNADRIIVATIDIAVLSRIVDRLADALGRPVFLLADGDFVLAHSRDDDDGFTPSSAQALPSLDDISDETLQGIWDKNRRDVISIENMATSNGHYFGFPGHYRVYIWTRVGSFAPLNWIVGYHFDSSTGDGEVGRFWALFGLSVLLLVACCALGVWLGSCATRPLRRLTSNVVALRNLSLEDYQPPANTRVRELDQTQGALDALARALRVFSRHLPPHLLQRVMTDGKTDLPAEMRRITVLVIDVVDLSSLTEGKTVRETAAFLRAHYAFIGHFVEKNGGFIDKFTDGGLVAFWGAPAESADQAHAAVAAAQAIRADFARSNYAARAEGRKPVRMSMGIHAGTALVGEIGSVRRVTYTAIGEAVEVAHRVETEARGVESLDATILASAALAAALGDDAPGEKVGEITAKHLTTPLALYAL